MQKENKNNILPIGFYDLVFDEAEKNHRKINLVLDYFLENNYRLVKTPLIEFQDNFNIKQIKDSFGFCDVISGKNLILRNDITLQIARLISTTLKHQELPLKICYVGDVLLTKSDELYADRQSTQVGIEIIGEDKNSSFEIIAMILQILPNIIDKKIAIEFCVPEFADILCDELEIQEKQELIAAIKEKNISLIKEIAKENAEIISEIVLKNGDLKHCVNKILDFVNSKKIAQKLDLMLKMQEFVKDNFDFVEIHFDLFGDNKNSSYHQEFAFDVFCEGFSYPIVRGGKYEINNIKSVGATIYMNYLRKIS